MKNLIFAIALNCFTALFFLLLPYASQAESVFESNYADPIHNPLKILSNPSQPLLTNLPPDNPLTRQTLTYTVKSGDWLSKIALEQYGDKFKWPALYAANSELIGINPNLIETGQTFFIPTLKDNSIVTCAAQEMTHAQLAAQRNISVQELGLLQTVRGLTLSEICEFSAEKLQRALKKAQNPKVMPSPTNPDAALKQRLLQQQDENGNIPSDAFSKAAQQIEVMKEGLNVAGGGLNGAGSWTWLGPGNIGGRSRSLVIHPSQPQNMWLGSVSGGIWKTNDGGASWQIQSDFLGNMAISSLVMDPTDSNTLYAGTGEGQGIGGERRGAGVFKTTTGGTNWSQLSSTTSNDWLYVNRLAIHPTDGQILLAATDTGLFKSSNGGSSWTQVITSGDGISDVNFDPTTPANVIASNRNAGAGFSTDTGTTWTDANFAAPGVASRIEVAYAPSGLNIVYASVNQNSGEIWRSADGGQNYTRMNTGSNFLGSQGDYDNIIWVNPQDAAFVIVGGIDLWRSIDSGATLIKISDWGSSSSIHADHHYILEHPQFNNTSNKNVFFNNDGGIYKTSNVLTVAQESGWQELNNNLGITQFYGAAGHTASGRIVGGTQDNGDLRYTGHTETWNEWGGGDGGFAAIDPTDANYVYGEYVALEIRRSTNGGEPSSELSIDKPTSGTQISDSRDQNKALFIAPFIIDPNNVNSLLGGGLSLWRTANVKEADLNNINWVAIKTATTNSEKISAIAVAPGNSNIIWVGHANETADAGNVYKTINGGTNWSQVDTNGIGLPNRYVTRITIDKDNSNIVYVTFGGFSADNVYRTTDGGATWSDISGAGATGLPDIPVRSLVIHPITTTWIYVGTEMGVFSSESNGTTWTISPQDGPTNTPVDELFWMGNDLLAATHGRGIFKATPGGLTSTNNTYLPVIIKN